MSLLYFSQTSNAIRVRVLFSIQRTLTIVKLTFCIDRRFYSALLLITHFHCQLCSIVNINWLLI